MNNVLRGVARRFAITFALLIGSIAFAASDLRAIDGAPNSPDLRARAGSTTSAKQQAQKSEQRRLREFSPNISTVEIKAPSEAERNAIHESNSQATVNKALQIGASRILDQEELASINGALTAYAASDQTEMAAEVQVLSTGAKALRLRFDFSDALPDEATFRFKGSETADVQTLDGRQIKHLWSADHYFWAPVTVGRNSRRRATPTSSVHRRRPSR